MDANTGGAQDASVEFVIRLARALHNYGTPTHQIEDTLETIAARIGINARFLATPTSIMISAGPTLDERVHLLRVEPGEQDLGRLSGVHDVARGIAKGELTPEAGSAWLAAIETAPPPYRGMIRVGAMGLSSAAAARFLAGGSREILVAGVIGLVIGVLAYLGERRGAMNRLYEPLSAFTASVLAAIAARAFDPVSVYLVTLAGIIILIPGFTSTVAVTELSNRHLVAGTARLFGAFTTLVVLAIGVAIGGTLMTTILGAAPPTEPIALPEWTLAIALLAAPLGFAVLLKAQPRDIPWIVIACGLGFAGTRLGGLILGPELGVFIGAVVVGLAGSVYGNVLRRPASVLRVPGILLLVPGSIGFRGLTALLDRQVVPGVETAFRMITIAVALAAGLLIASVVAPSKITK
ncbi:MAG TPA: threonine/serine exporter family protein [Gemmatimonadales bacterium]|jgi:uncharacterized membrane protein YjjP (DUF1212 family)